MPTGIPSSPSEGNFPQRFYNCFLFNSNHIIDRRPQGTSADQPAGAEEEDTQNTTPHASPITPVTVPHNLSNHDHVYFSQQFKTCSLFVSIRYNA